MDHLQRCAAAAAALDAVTSKPQTLVGFDGFVDAIIDVVSKRHDGEHYEALATIADFGARVSAAAGQSANFELVVRQTKIGGNGPIMANALLGYGHRITYTGVIGDGSDVHEAFRPLADGAENIIGMGPPAATDALEFDDGKLMLGKMTPMNAVTYERLLDCVGAERLRTLLAEVDGIATVNWTMTLSMTDIWQRLANEVLPGLRDTRPLWFVDLADPAKRTVADLTAALDAIRGLQEHCNVVLGMNGSEGRQVMAALGGTWEGEPEAKGAAQVCCEYVREHLGVSHAVCHLVSAAACAWDGGSDSSDGFFCSEPLITTGAGDHFNAGFFASLSAGIEPGLALAIGGATSGYYVRTGQSPQQSEVVGFLREWQNQGAV